MNGELSPVPWKTLEIQNGNRIQATLKRPMRRR